MRCNPAHLRYPDIGGQTINCGLNVWGTKIVPSQNFRKYIPRFARMVLISAISRFSSSTRQTVTVQNDRSEIEKHGVNCR